MVGYQDRSVVSCVQNEYGGWWVDGVGATGLLASHQMVGQYCALVRSFLEPICSNKGAKKLTREMRSIIPLFQQQRCRGDDAVSAW